MATSSPPLISQSSHLYSPFTLTPHSPWTSPSPLRSGVRASLNLVRIAFRRDERRGGEGTGRVDRGIVERDGPKERRVIVDIVGRRDGRMDGRMDGRRERWRRRDEIEVREGWRGKFGGGRVGVDGMEDEFKGTLRMERFGEGFGEGFGEV